MSRDSAPILIGLDLDASRARAVAGVPGQGHTLPLVGQQPELPLALSLESGVPEVGRAGLHVCRRLPHLACLDFLPSLEQPRTWACGRRKLDARAALTLVLQELPRACASAHALVLALPAYLTAAQMEAAARVAAGARLPVGGWMAAPLAAALAAHAEQGWFGPALVLDVDEHALTCTVIATEEGWAHVADSHALPRLGLRAWKERLLDAVSERCIRHSRRDPRDSAAAEQALYEQLETALDTCQHGQIAELVIEAPHWYQDLLLRPEELVHFCRPLVQQTLEMVERLRAGSGWEGPVLVSAAAGRLPGLLAALERQADTERGLRPARGGNFSEDAADDHQDEVRLLSPEATAWAAHLVAEHICQGDVAAGAVQVAPLPAPQPVEAGPPRLHFRGRDHVLRSHSFVLGRHSDCDLVFDADTYPGISAHHCQIILEQGGYSVRDCSNQGTSVNDRPVLEQLPLRPGDWIRLGPHGPRLRFLGQAPAPHSQPRSAASG